MTRYPAAPSLHFFDQERIQLIVREDSKIKRLALVFLTTGLMAFVCAAASNAQAEDGCTREDLTKIADKYFVSIREHKASDLPLASTIETIVARENDFALKAIGYSQ
jgi:hypothetical protein